MHGETVKFKISNFMKIRPMGTELFHAEGRTDWHAWRSVVNFRNYAEEAVTFTLTVMVDG